MLTSGRAHGRLTHLLFAAHPGAAIEYWFFKVNAGPVALLVDWIERRRSGQHLLRLSLHSPDRRGVLFEQQDALMPGAGPYLQEARTIGHIGDISWDLQIDLGAPRIAPDVFPARLLRLPDLAIVSAPLASFTGSITIGGVAHTLNRSRGMLSHYWGRGLAPDWWWISANQFDQDEVAVECTVLRSRLWGSSLTVPLGYLYIRQGARERLIMAPLGLARVSGSPEEVSIHIQQLGSRPFTLVASGRDYGYLGDGIINTLVGDLEIWEGEHLLARARGTAGIERRMPGRAAA